jgi:hypothetical protein
LLLSQLAGWHASPPVQALRSDAVQALQTLLTQSGAAAFGHCVALTPVPTQSTQTKFRHASLDEQMVRVPPVLHATHWPLDSLQAGKDGEVQSVASLASLQPRQLCEVVSQIGVLPPQSPLSRQPTQV